MSAPLQFELRHITHTKDKEISPLPFVPAISPRIRDGSKAMNLMRKSIVRNDLLQYII